MPRTGLSSRLFVAAGLLTLLAAPAGAEIRTRLSPQDIELALLPSSYRRPPLRLRDVGSWFAGSGRGYTITVFTPTSWVRHLAAMAAAGEGRLSVEDLTPEDVRPILRVLAEPSTPTPGARLEQSSSVRRVAILRKTGSSAIEPVDDEPTSASFRNLAGSRVTFGGMVALFSLEDLRDLRGTDEEFVIRIVGTGYTKDFEIKRKHFAQLP